VSVHPFLNVQHAQVRTLSPIGSVNVTRGIYHFHHWEARRTEWDFAPIYSIYTDVGGLIDCSMLEQLNVLCYNLGKRKQVQWSLRNDERLKMHQVILQVEPYVYEAIQTKQACVGSYRNWQPVTPSIRREDGYLRHSFHAMI